AASPVWAQNGNMKATGQFTTGHVGRCQNSQCTVVGDGGGAAGSSVQGSGYLTEIGITNPGMPFAINSALVNSASGYRQLALGFDSNGNGVISFNSFGGAPNTSLKCQVNGQFYDCINNGTGNVIGPNSSNLGTVPLWNNNSGTSLKDGGNTLSTLSIN